MKVTLTITGFVCLLCVTGITQNLLSNSDFEDVNICHVYKELCSPKAWRATTLKLFGYDKDEVQGKYINLLLFDLAKKSSRKFAQTELIIPIKSNQEYRLKIKVKPDQFWINKVYFAFLDAPIFNKDIEFNQLPTKILHLDIPRKIEKDKWITLEKIFTVDEEKKYFIFGNLKEDEHVTSQPLDAKYYKKYLKKGNPKKRIKYSFDNIEIIPTDRIDSLSDQFLLNRKIEIYTDSVRHGLYKLVLEKEFPITTVPDSVIKVQKNILKQKDIPKKLTIYNLNFENNQFRLPINEQYKLDVIVNILKENQSLKARIVGHTDAVGAESYNLILSLKRAETVKAYLVSKMIAESRLSTEGFGETQTLFDNDDKEKRYLNRRVDILFE